MHESFMLIEPPRTISTSRLACRLASVLWFRLRKAGLRKYFHSLIVTVSASVSVGSPNIEAFSALLRTASYTTQSNKPLFSGNFYKTSTDRIVRNRAKVTDRNVLTSQWCKSFGLDVRSLHVIVSSPVWLWIPLNARLLKKELSRYGVRTGKLSIP